MIKDYRQHIPAFVVATRKCFTVALSLFWYKHSLCMLQGLGILMVFSSVLLEVYSNYLNAQKPDGEHLPLQS